MALTRNFKETVLLRAQQDAEFRHALLLEAVNEMLNGNAAVARNILRDYINATITFKLLAKELHKDPKSLQRMLGPKGNPTSESLIRILYILQEYEGIRFRVHKE